MDAWKAKAVDSDYPTLANCCILQFEHKLSAQSSLRVFHSNSTKLYRGTRSMLWTVFVILLILWALGLATGATLNGFIHILLVIAIVVVLLRVIQGRRIA